MINEQSHIYQGAIGQLELLMRKQIERHQNGLALGVAKSPEYLRLCRAQHEPYEPMFFYRTAEDPRVLAMKLRHQVPEVKEDSLIGTTRSSLRGAFEHIITNEKGNKFAIYEDLSSAYLLFCEETMVPEVNAMAMLDEISKSIGSEEFLRQFNGRRRTYQPKLENFLKTYKLGQKD